MKNTLATVHQFAVLPGGTIARGAGVFDMLTESVPAIVREKLLEINITPSGAVEVFRKPGYKASPRAQK